MKYKEFGEKNRPTVILLHGGGLSWWSLKNIIHYLKIDYHVVTPIIDGHGEDGATTFISIQDSAEKLIRYIDMNYKGKVLAIGGLSLGAQITIEILAKRANITEYAIIESALVYPPDRTTWFTVPACKLFYSLISKRWFAKLQARTLCITKDMFEQYYKDSLNISKESLINIILNNGSYTVPDGLKNTNAKVLIIFGFKEVRIMDKSIRKLMNTIPDSQVCIAPGMRHGEFSLVHYTEYLAVIKHFMA
jgi:pimeloyl-ACP methyl ester carboxylesterase